MAKHSHSCRTWKYSTCEEKTCVNNFVPFTKWQNCTMYTLIQCILIVFKSNPKQEHLTI